MAEEIISDAMDRFMAGEISVNELLEALSIAQLIVV